MDNSVEIDNLRKTFVVKIGRGLRRTRREVVAVDGISLAIPAGQAVAFIGPNGAGKSTTIKMLTGILHPTSGHAQVLGFIPWRERRTLVRQIGAVFGQRSQLWYHLPPRDTFELLARIYDIPREQYRQRRDLLREWNREEGLTVFLTSHDAGDIEGVARRVIVINHGRVVLDDKVSAMRRRYLGSKVLSVKFHAPHTGVALPGITTLKATEYALKLEVDTQITPIEVVMTEVLRAGSVADIAIEDPPLEEVIAHIYGQSAIEEPVLKIEDRR